MAVAVNHCIQLILLLLSAYKIKHWPDPINKISALNLCHIFSIQVLECTLTFLYVLSYLILTSVTRSGDLLDFGQHLNAFGNT